MTTLGLLTWIAHRNWGQYSSSIVQSRGSRNLIRFSLVILLMQIFLGGWTSTNYAALACTDFPTCHGAWMPDMDFKDAFHMVRELGQSADGGNLTLASLTAIQWTHRVGAIITLIYLGFLALNSLKYSLGIANLVLHLPLVLAVGHNLGAALLVIILVIFNSKITGSKVNRT